MRGKGAWSSGADSPMSASTRLAVSGIDQLAKAHVGGFVSPESLIAKAVRANALWVADPLGDIIGLVEGRVDAVLAPDGCAGTTPPRSSWWLKPVAGSPTASVLPASTPAVASTAMESLTSRSKEPPCFARATGQTDTDPA